MVCKCNLTSHPIYIYSTEIFVIWKSDCCLCVSVWQNIVSASRTCWNSVKVGTCVCCCNFNFLNVCVFCKENDIVNCFFNNPFLNICRNIGWIRRWNFIKSFSIVCSANNFCFIGTFVTVDWNISIFTIFKGEWNVFINSANNNCKCSCVFVIGNRNACSVHFNSV